MTGFGKFMLVTSLAFAVFSVAYGAKYDTVRHADRYSSPERRVERTAELEGIHAVVKPVSIAYYALCLGFFVRGLRRSPWRKLCVLGVVASTVMVLWSLILGAGASFDEVYPAWVVAAVVLASLQLVVQRSPGVERRAATVA